MEIGRSKYNNCNQRSANRLFLIFLSPNPLSHSLPLSLSPSLPLPFPRIDFLHSLLIGWLGCFFKTLPWFLRATRRKWNDSLRFSTVLNHSLARWEGILWIPWDSRESWLIVEALPWSSSSWRFEKKIRHLCLLLDLFETANPSFRTLYPTRNWFDGFLKAHRNSTKPSHHFCYLLHADCSKHHQNPDVN